MNKEQLDLLLKLINKKIRSENLSKFTFGNTLVLPLTEDSEKIDIVYLMNNYINMFVDMLLASAYQNNGNLTVPEDAIAGKLIEIKQYIIEIIGEKDYKCIIMMIPDIVKYEQNILRLYISFDYLNDDLYFELTTKDKVILLDYNFDNNVEFHSVVTDRDSQVINLDGNSVVPQSVEPQPSSRYLTLNMSNKNYIAILNNDNVIIKLNDDRISQSLINDGIDNDNIEISLVVNCNTNVSLSFDGFHYMLEENSSCGLQANCCYNIIIKRVVDMYLIKIDKYISTSLPS